MSQSNSVTLKIARKNTPQGQPRLTIRAWDSQSQELAERRAKKAVKQFLRQKLASIREAEIRARTPRP